MTGEHDPDEGFAPSRRAVLAGAGAVAVAVLGGCSTYDQNAPVDQPADSDADDPSGDEGSGGGAGEGGSTDDDQGQEVPQQALALTGDIPVGGGKVISGAQVVVTQPKAGTFKCFTAICTHQGCTVSSVENGTINCPCHGSKFRINDGSVEKGPAAKALRSVSIKVDGDSIVRG